MPLIILHTELLIRYNYIDDQAMTWLSKKKENIKSLADTQYLTLFYPMK